VKKIPITIDCIHQDYNITEPQPQLFVTKHFKDLTSILLEYSETMAYKTGGISGVEKAILSENITTSVYDSGLQVSGTLTNFIKDNNKEMGYLSFGGAVQLSYNDSEIEGHGITYHSEGYGAAVGILSKINLPLHQLDNNQLESLGIKENSKILLNFIGGLIVSGTVKKVLTMDDSPILISLDNCAIRLNGDYLYRPEWGAYDLACGSKIVSVFGGAADWDNYYKNKFSTSGSTHQSTNLNKENTKLNELYKQVRRLRENNKPSSNYLPILKKLYDEHPDDWLLCADIYEEIYSDPTLIGEKKLLKDHINKFAKNKMLSDVINRFINLIEA
jgi:phenylalanine-4-hydroxylase